MKHCPPIWPVAAFGCTDLSAAASVTSAATIAAIAAIAARCVP